MNDMKLSEQMRRYVDLLGYDATVSEEYIESAALLEAENAALKEENQRLQQELYDNDEAWRLESLASDERIRDE